MSKIKVFALGGLNENGKNMYVVNVDEEIFIFDCGLKYDNDINLGIDYIIPGHQFLIDNKDKIKGLFLSHGHESNMGATPDILEAVPDIPVYGTHLTLEILKNTYPIRTCNIDIDKAIKTNMRPCLNLHIKRCVGPCTGKVNKEEYNKMIEEIILFLSGKEEKLIDILKEKMNKCAMDFNFEEAAIYRDKIKSLEDMMEKQKIDASTSDLNQDIIAMARAHDEACVQVFFVRNGKIVGREHFILEGVMDSTRESILGSFVKQFYMEQEYIPKEIIIEDEIEDMADKVFPKGEK